MTAESVLLAVDPKGIATVTLNRAELLNALDDSSVGLLTAMLETLAEDASVRAVVLTGSGISFSAGHDIDWMRRMAGFGREELERHARLLAKLLRTLDTLPKPTIAKIQGSAFGLGAGLVACCDVSIASSEALFSFSDVKLGVIPALVAPYMVRAIGERSTRRYFMTAERFNAGKAKRLGLVHQVVESDELDMAVDFLINHLLINGPAAMLEAKRLLADIAGLGVGEESMELCIQRIVAIRLSEEGREGVQAMLETRKPAWMD